MLTLNHELSRSIDKIHGSYCYRYESPSGAHRFDMYNDDADFMLVEKFTNGQLVARKLVTDAYVQETLVFTLNAKGYSIIPDSRFGD